MKHISKRFSFDFGCIWGPTPLQLRVTRSTGGCQELGMCDGTPGRVVQREGKTEKPMEAFLKTFSVSSFSTRFFDLCFTFTVSHAIHNFKVLRALPRCHSMKYPGGSSQRPLEQASVFWSLVASMTSKNSIIKEDEHVWSSCRKKKVEAVFEDLQTSNWDM